LVLWSGRTGWAVAQEWADSLLARREFDHRSKQTYGENLFQIAGRDPDTSAAHVVEAWAGEARDYDYTSNGCRRVCGHYTQIVWRDTREVGCALARNSAREVWVCQYSPPGNIIGHRPW